MDARARRAASCTVPRRLLILTMACSSPRAGRALRLRRTSLRSRSHHRAHGPGRRPISRRSGCSREEGRSPPSRANPCWTCTRRRGRSAPTCASMPRTRGDSRSSSSCSVTRPTRKATSGCGSSSRSGRTGRRAGWRRPTCGSRRPPNASSSTSPSGGSCGSAKARPVARLAVAVGSAATPTPPGRYFVWAKVETDRPSGPYGSFILGLSGFSECDRAMDGVAGPTSARDPRHRRPGRRGSGREQGCIRVLNSLLSLRSSATRPVPYGRTSRVRTGPARSTRRAYGYRSHHDALPACGADNPEGARFCNACGERLEPAAASGQRGSVGRAPRGHDAVLRRARIDRDGREARPRGLDRRDERGVRAPDRAGRSARGHRRTADGRRDPRVLRRPDRA